MTLEITYPVLRQAVKALCLDLGIKGCVVVSLKAKGHNLFPLWHKANSIKGILPVWNNDNDAGSDY